MRRILASLLLAVSAPLWAAQPVRARHGMVVTRERHATEAGLKVLESGGNADRCRGRGRVRPRRHASLCGQSRRRRLHAHPPGRRTHHVHRFPRARARRRFAQHVPRRRRQGHPGQHRRLPRLGRSRHASAASSTLRRSTAGSRGPTSCGPPSSWPPKASPSPTRRRRASKRPRGCSAASRNRSASSCAAASSTSPARPSCSPSWPAPSTASRGPARKDFYEGETARLLAEDMQEHGGLITLDDLKAYTRHRAQAAHRHVSRL